MSIIFCDSVFDQKKVEPDYEEEMKAAKKAGFQCFLISFEELISGNVSKALKYVNNTEENEIGIYRGWMLTPNQYDALYQGLLAKNIRLINNPEEYQHCHYLPYSYHKIKDFTPLTTWTNNLTTNAILEAVSVFKHCPIIVKDYVKSEKHNWERACYIPNASDIEKLTSVTNKFIELRGASLNEGLVFRKFEELEFLTDHSKSKMPLTKEFRLFFANKKLVSILNYWDEGNYGATKPDLEKFKEIADTIESNFFTIDIAKKQDGNWIIMELGDGQVAGLPNNADVDLFYYDLKESLI